MVCWIYCYPFIPRGIFEGQFLHSFCIFEELKSCQAKGYNYFWPNNVYLLEKVISAGFYFCSFGLSVARRSALHHICYEQLLSAKRCLFKGFIKKFSSFAYERFSCHVFCFARSFTHQHYFSTFQSFAWHSVYSIFAKFTFRA